MHPVKQMTHFLREGSKEADGEHGPGLGLFKLRREQAPWEWMAESTRVRASYQNEEDKHHSRLSSKQSASHSVVLAVSSTRFPQLLTKKEDFSFSRFLIYSQKGL